MSATLTCTCSPPEPAMSDALSVGLTFVALSLPLLLAAFAASRSATGNRSKKPLATQENEDERMDNITYVIQDGEIRELNQAQCKALFLQYAKYITDKDDVQRRVDHLVDGYRYDVVYVDEQRGSDRMSYMKLDDAEDLRDALNEAAGYREFKIVGTPIWRIAHWLDDGKRKIDKRPDFTSAQMAEMVLDLYAKFDFDHHPSAPRMYDSREIAEAVLNAQLGDASDNP